jgi:hypothetical protein
MSKLRYESSSMTADGPIASTAHSRRRSPAITRRVRQPSVQLQSKSFLERPDILYEDKEGRWHDELSPGTDRPETEVEG